MSCKKNLFSELNFYIIAAKLESNVELLTQLIKIIEIYGKSYVLNIIFKILAISYDLQMAPA